ncbi:MAG: ring-cleaving dioxygenase [Phycisphaerales bacterium]
MQLTGLHHVTAVSARIQDNYRFYTRTLGMRLVKRSVNQDDVSAYHLFYADAVGSPGSDLTFFDWPVPPERRGSRTPTRTMLRVAGTSTLEAWRERLTAADLAPAPIVERDGRLTLDFEDPEGQRLALVDDAGIGPAHPWDRSPIPAADQVRGLGPIVLTVPALAPTAAALEQMLGMRRERSYPDPTSTRHAVHVFAMGPGGAAAEVHVAERPDLPPGRLGAGGVHHVAFRCPDADYDAWADRLATLGVPFSGKVDRFWFRSLYVREPNGILFEIATEGPGFGVDEDPAHCGETVVLPPFLESRRAAIVANLAPLGE